MGNNTWDNTLDPFPNARGTAKNTFTTWQDVAGIASNTGSLPRTLGNELKVGSQVELEAWGEYSTTGTPTLQLGFIYNATPAAAGGTILAQNALTATATGAAAWMWHLHWAGVVTSEGATGVIYGSGILDLGASLTAINAGIALPTTAAARSVTIDTTIKALWGVGAAWGTSSVSNQVIVDAFRAKVVNQGKTS